jgi:catechol 2,3-dioxygenase-like lactoylglutathione lyase family enzyme
VVGRGGLLEWAMVVARFVQELRQARDVHRRLSFARLDQAAAGSHTNLGLNNTADNEGERLQTMDMKLEVVVIPVSDVDRAKNFYTELGWRLDADFVAGDFRVVQLTPPGSQCSVIFGTGLTTAAPGSTQGLQLVVTDVGVARVELAGHGVDVSEVFHDAGGVFHHAGDQARVSGRDPNGKSYASFVSFSDPDGNSWFVQEITTRLPGR